MNLRLMLALLLLPSMALAQTPPDPAPAEPAPAEPAPAETTPAEPAPAEETAPVKGIISKAAVIKALQKSTEPVGNTRTLKSSKANAGFMDSRLSFTCTHEDVLRDPTVLPSAPGFHCGRPNGLGVLFFDNYDTRFSGFETLTHLALYKRESKNAWDIEAGLIIRVNELAEDNIRLGDGGSYIRVAYFLDPERKSQNHIAFTAFPVSSDRMRLGYSYRLSWGGSPEFFKPNPDAPGSSGKNKESVPGAKLQFNSDTAYAYVGLKTSLLLDPVINEKRSVLAGIAGAGVDITPMLRIEANGGLFDRGKNETEDVLGERVVLYGGSVQVALHDGMPVGSSIDYKLYRNDPANIDRLFHKEQYPGGLSWLVSAEATVLAQTLKDPEKTGSTTTQKGFAGDVNVRIKLNRTRFKFDLMTRDLAYILHSIPSLPTYSAFPAAHTNTRELFAALGVDQHFDDSDLTLGVTVGMDKPATLTAPSATAIPGNLTTSTTFVVRNASDRTGLPMGESVAIIWALKGSARIDFGESFSAFADIYYQYDPNLVKYDRDDPNGSFARAQFAGFNQLGFNATLQARF